MTKRVSIHDILRGMTPEQRARHNLHNRFLRACKKLPEDYDPWGENERWADPARGYPDCSGGCKFAMWVEPLTGDWCVCMNPKSHRYGLLTFEHQGCEKAEAGDLFKPRRRIPAPHKP